MKLSTVRWLLLGLVVLLLTVPAWAATVTNLNDSGAGSLRQAIIDAASGDTIDFSVTGTITLISPDQPTDVGQLTIDKNLTITGPGADKLTIKGGGYCRIFNIGTSGNAAISGLTVAAGYDVSVSGGGGILNAGTVTLYNVTVSGNYSPNHSGGIDNHHTGTMTLTNCTVEDNDTRGDGGGIYNAGTMTLENCTISDNIAGTESGGGIYNDGTLTLTNCTINDNMADEHGGGIYNDGTLTLTNCTISGNASQKTPGGHPDPKTRNGGGIYNWDTLTLENCTVSGNSAEDFGGGIYNGNTLTSKNTIIANNTATNTGPDCDGPLNSYGYNMIENTSGCTITVVENSGTDITEQDPRLGSLQDNGGPTETHGLFEDSLAINAGSCSDIDGNAVTEDQRGEVRPQQGACDIGAYESPFTSAAPEMDVSGLGNSITDGDATPSTTDDSDLGAALIAGGTVEHTFTIRNTGTLNLDLTGAPRVQVLGANAADFTVTAQPISPVTSGGGTTTFTVRFDPSAAGTRSATISIANNDADENPYDFSIQGNGIDSGDVNADGKIDVLDARLCLQIALGTITGTAAQRVQADVDGDGDVDMDDARMLAEYVIGIRTTLPGGEST